MTNDFINDDSFLAISMYLIKIDVHFVKPKSKKYFEELMIEFYSSIFAFGYLYEHAEINKKNKNIEKTDKFYKLQTKEFNKKCDRMIKAIRKIYKSYDRKLCMS